MKLQFRKRGAAESACLIRPIAGQSRGHNNPKTCFVIHTRDLVLGLISQETV